MSEFIEWSKEPRFTMYKKLLKKNKNKDTTYKFSFLTHGILF